MELTVYQLYQKMFQAMGPQGWWPADSKEEIIVGAILVQNTNWQNVDYSLANLRKLTAFKTERIAKLDQEQLIQAIRPSGFYHNKSRGLLAVFNWLLSEGGDFQQIAEKYGSHLRNELLKLPSVGQETADALLLYVFEQKVFMADTYAQRLFKNLGVLGIKNYQSLKKLVKIDQLNLSEAQEFHGLIVNFGKDYLKGATNFANSFLAGDQLMMKAGMLV